MLELRTAFLNRSILVAVTEKTGGESGQGTRVSIFGIIIVGLIAGLIVGLITSPSYTAQGFFLGFAGGSLITVAVYFLSIQRSPRR
jgi:glucose uptake protein GlcU